MSALDDMALLIVKEQELVIGPMAWSEAKKVAGLMVTERESVLIDQHAPDHKAVVDRLVMRYEHLFGRASQEVCRDAAAHIIASIPQSEVPTSLLR